MALRCWAQPAAPAPAPCPSPVTGRGFPRPDGSHFGSSQVLFCYEQFDELTLLHLREFDKKKLMSVETDIVVDHYKEEKFEDSSPGRLASLLSGHRCGWWPGVQVRPGRPEELALFATRPLRSATVGLYGVFFSQLAFLRLIKLKRIRHFKALTKLYGPQAIKSILSGVQIYLLNFR